MTELNLTQKEQIPRSQIRKNILSLAWPVIIEMGLVTLVKILDMIMVGQLGVKALDAVGLTLQPLMLAMIIFRGLSVGTTALVARFIGENRHEQANLTFQQSLLSSTLMAIGLYFVAPYILIGMGAKSPEIIQLGTDYVRWLVPGVVFQWVFLVVSAALRGAGDTKTPMFANIIINILNVLGNYFLIFGYWIFPEMGVSGAGLATSIARIVGFIIIIFLVSRRDTILRIRWESFFKFDWSILSRILKIGIPATLEQAVLRIGQTWYTKVVRSLGSVAFAAHTAAINAEAISYMPGWGFSVAATTMVGQKLGEGEKAEAEASGYESLKIGIAIMGFMGLFFLIMPETLMKLYVDMSNPNSQELVRLGARNLRIIALAQIPMAIQFILAGALRGAGYTKPVLYSTMAGVWVGRLLGAMIFIHVFNWGLLGAWIAMCIDWFMRALYVLYLWKKGKWKFTEV